MWCDYTVHVLETQETQVMQVSLTPPPPTWLPPCGTSPSPWKGGGGGQPGELWQSNSVAAGVSEVWLFGLLLGYCYFYFYFNQPSAVRFVFKFFCSVSVSLVSVDFTVSYHQCHTTTSVFCVIWTFEHVWWSHSVRTQLRVSPWLKGLETCSASSCLREAQTSGLVKLELQKLGG